MLLLQNFNRYVNFGHTQKVSRLTRMVQLHDENLSRQDDIPWFTK